MPLHRLALTRCTPILLSIKRYVEKTGFPSKFIVHRKHFKIIILLSYINLNRYMILRSNDVLDFCIVLNVK